MISVNQADKSLVDNLTAKKRGIFSRAILNHRAKVAKIEPMAQPADVLFFDMLVPIEGGVQISTEVYIPKGENIPLFIKQNIGLSFSN